MAFSSEPGHTLGLCSGLTYDDKWVDNKEGLGPVLGMSGRVGSITDHRARGPRGPETSPGPGQWVGRSADVGRPGPHHSRAKGMRDLAIYHGLKGISAEFQVIRGFSQKIPADLLSYDKIHS